MAPQDVGQGGEQQQDETNGVGPEEPGLEHAEDAQQDAGYDNPLDYAVGAGGDIVVQHRRHNHDQGDVGEQDGDEDEKKGDGRNQDVFG